MNALQPLYGITRLIAYLEWCFASLTNHVTQSRAATT